MDSLRKWLLPTAFLLLLPNFINRHLVSFYVSGTDSSSFDTHLAARLKSIDQLSDYVDSVSRAGNVPPQSRAYADILSNTVYKRFAAGYSHYALNENWMAALSGKIIWDDLSAIVLADDIMKYPMAACSQQGLVLMELFRRKQIPARVIGFDHHFAVEGKLNNEWLYFDANLNPHFTADHRPAFESLQNNDSLRKVYTGIIPAHDIDSLLAHPTVGKINVIPGYNARLFHRVTKFLSHWLWLVPLVLYFGLRHRARKQWKNKKFSTSLTTG